jgi:hypothetical protein
MMTLLLAQFSSGLRESMFKHDNIPMTAEIAVLNKHGVALAADSAITIRKPNTKKILNSASNLFMLSKYHPVGAMVYGTASLMGITWETIIKLYREASFLRLFPAVYPAITEAFMLVECMVQRLNW